ncbi:hypothetical protein PRIPAC_87609 [Pristionchus pacificus]|uniref:Uncharacterized protein n=1 Tax=Pristionchus pacificus TaxID=54126 RepID=A0A2A6B640_PRIPA|nr:hypothetical protein PRIPAC_87609 [Pristionchus pacificus]|eukprot:PDM61350.1 hypothetical protein PRIPAC_50792 [Pristionchus pacificus]
MVIGARPQLIAERGGLGSGRRRAFDHGEGLTQIQQGSIDNAHWGHLTYGLTATGHKELRNPGRVGTTMEKTVERESQSAATFE